MWCFRVVEVVDDEDDDNDDTGKAIWTGAGLVRRGGCGRATGQTDSRGTHHVGQGSRSRCKFLLLLLTVIRQPSSDSNILQKHN